MDQETELTDAAKLYAAAYKKHYDKNDVHTALAIYKRVMNEHPDSREAERSESQIQNIVRDYVPKKVLCEALLALVANYIHQKEPANKQ